MQSHRLISGLTIFLMVVLVAIGYFLVAQPQLAAASSANAQLASVNTQIAASQATITRLKSEKAKLPELTAQLAALRASIPGDAQISSYIDGLNALAASSGVSITGITVSAATSYAPPVAVATGPAGGASASPSPSPSATAPAAPAAPTTPTGWTPTTDPSITTANFVAIPVTVITSGPTANTLGFIKGLQSGTRLFLVSGISTSVSGATAGSINATIQGFIYVLIDPAAASSDATTPTPTPSPTATPTPSATPSPSGSASPTPTPSPTSTQKP